MFVESMSIQTYPLISPARHCCPKQMRSVPRLVQVLLPKDTPQTVTSSICRPNHTPRNYTSASAEDSQSVCSVNLAPISTVLISLLKLTLQDRPLYYQEMIERWCQALMKRETARQTFEAAHQEFDDYASDIVEVIGRPTYSHFLGLYLAALTPNTITRE